MVLISYRLVCKLMGGYGTPITTIYIELTGSK